MTIRGVVRNWGDTTTLPVFQGNGIRCIGPYEGETFLKIAETSAIRGNGIQKVPHWRVVHTVPNQDQIKQPCCIVNEVGHDTPSQIKLSKILIG